MCTLWFPLSASTLYQDTTGIDEILTFSKLKYILSGMLYLFKIIKTGFHLQKMSAMKQDIYVSCDD